jgi:predicted transcriptional regulator
MRGFGDLEAAVMHCLWSSDALMSVREVRDALAEDRDLAYTTVMTVLDNLHKKGWVRRELDGRAYLYEPVASREAYTAQLMSEALDSSDDRPAAFLHFVDAMSTEDTEALRQALRKVSRRRSRR